MSDKCTFPYCRQNIKPGTQYCYDHGRLMKVKTDKPAVKPEPGIAKVSDTMKEQLKLYKKLRKPFLTKNYKCQVKGCNNASTEIHHPRGREGELLNKVELWLAVCHEHHRKITDDSSWAYENGYSLSRLSTEPNNAA